MRRALPLLAAALVGFAVGWFLRSNLDGPAGGSVPPPAPVPEVKQEPQALPPLETAGSSPPGGATAPATGDAPVEVHLGAVEGTVRDVAKGPLVGVTVLLHEEWRASGRPWSATTGPDGRFRVESVPEGTYRAALFGGSVGRSALSMGKLVVPSGGATIARDFVVGWPGLTGIVTDAETGAPIPGVSITVQIGGPYRKAATDAEGTYRIPHLGPGEYQLFVSKDGYGIEVPTGVRVSEDGGTLDLSLTPAALLVVKITDAHGRPVAGTVDLIYGSATGPGARARSGIRADETGRAVCHQIVPGDYALEFRVTGVGHAKVTARIEAGENRIEARLEKE